MSYKSSSGKEWIHLNIDLRLNKSGYYAFKYIKL